MEAIRIITLALGLDTDQLTLWQMGLRAAIIYLVGLTIVRLGGDRRFTGKHAAFDVVLSVVLGSTLSRAINGSAPFFKTLAAALVLVGIHLLFSMITCRSERFDRLIKGKYRVLIRDGHVHKKAMRDGYISNDELQTALRLGAKITDPAEVSLAFQERNGSISILPKEKPPQIIEVHVENGVQTVRIQLE